jgi:hypothetical protein
MKKTSKVLIVDDNEEILNAGRSREDARSELAAYLDERGRPAIQVRDNGIGIPEENLDKVFIPFFSTKEGGSGIGLSLSRQILLRSSILGLLVKAFFPRSAEKWQGPLKRARMAFRAGSENTLLKASCPPIYGVHRTFAKLVEGKKGHELGEDGGLGVHRTLLSREQSADYTRTRSNRLRVQTR